MNHPTHPSVCVFCGASPQADMRFQMLATDLGQALVKAHFNLVYGGGGRGLMGALARSALSANGYVQGVIPQFLIDLEKADLPLSQLHVVATMHERKAKMAELSQAFVILPGGIGTLEEFFEIFTGRQLQQHKKPIILFNFDGFYDLLITFLHQKQDQHFLHGDAMSHLIIEHNIEGVIKTLSQHITQR
jgi:uncharacterized protein (TIGR00730 family)